MTKKILISMTGGLVLICSAALAQPTLTATGINPKIGESFTLKGSSYEDPGNSGANQTWDLSAMTGNSAGLTTVVAPSTTTNGASFTSANVAWNNPTQGGVNYLKTSGTAFQNYGFFVGGTVISYDNPEDMLRFPFTYNDTYQDNWSSEFTNAGMTFYRTGTTTVTADGYGTLITPAKTYTNVTRVHFFQEYQDSSEIGLILYYENDEYMWYVNGEHVPVASVFDLISTQGGFSGGNFLFSSTNGIQNPADLSSGLKLYPNPAIDQVNVDFSLTENAKVDVVIFNAAGQQLDIDQTMNGVQGTNTVHLDIASLPEGIYFMQIMSDGMLSSNRRFVVAR